MFDFLIETWYSRGMLEKRAIDEVVVREDLYPRIRVSVETVGKYRENLEVLPPIEINQNNELIDGMHRLTAHKDSGATEIGVVITETKTEAELLRLAVIRNRDHGLQLSNEDKRALAIRWYNGLTPVERTADTKRAIATDLSVVQKTVDRWLNDIDKATREERNDKLFNLWMACYTQEEIAEELGIEPRTVGRHIESFGQNGQLSKMSKTNPNFATFSEDGYKPPYFNVWTATGSTNADKRPGYTEQRWLENLLYAYTEPGDIVIDPFGGGGSTIDVCKKRLRRFLVSDLNPSAARGMDMRKHDANEGPYPLKGRWQDVGLVYLDPPYWKQALGMYGPSADSPSNPANMTLDTFHDFMERVILEYADKLKEGHIAFICQPTQWNTDEYHTYADHSAEMIRRIDLPIDMRIQAPLTTQSLQPAMVDWAKSNRSYLALNREIIVWRMK